MYVNIKQSCIPMLILVHKATNWRWTCEWILSIDTREEWNILDPWIENKKDFNIKDGGKKFKLEIWNIHIGEK